MRTARPSYDRLIFELSSPGRFAHSLPACDVPESDPAAFLPKAHLRERSPELPEVSEVDVIRHYSRLSHMNYGVDTHFYPLGSCTMKYNPKINEDMARLPGFLRLHPLAPEAASQGALALMHELARDLADLFGRHARVAGESLDFHVGMRLRPWSQTSLRVMPPCALKTRVGANSPSLWPTMFSVT